MSKTILITGSTDGIGKEAAEKLAKDGYQVLIHGRTEQKVSDCVAELKQKTKNEDIHGYSADLSDFDNIDRLSAELKSKHPHIDVLINNAGVFQSPNAKNAKGLDLRFMVNYLAPYYLTSQVADLISASEDGRIINLSSAAQESVSLDALTGKANISIQSGYAQSKLALTMWSFDMSKKRDDLTIIAVNPGSLLNTKMVQEAYGKFWAPAEKGANILQLLSTDDKYKGLKEKYFNNDLGNPMGDFGPAHPDAYQEELIKKLIDTTEQLINARKEA